MLYFSLLFLALVCFWLFLRWQQHQLKLVSRIEIVQRLGIMEDPRFECLARITYKGKVFYLFQEDTYLEWEDIEGMSCSISERYILHLAYIRKIRHIVSQLQET